MDANEHPSHLDTGAHELDQADEESSEFDPLWNVPALSRIRSLSGVDNFLNPTPFEELQKVDASGPVVTLNASRLRCDALIMSSSSVTSVPLSGCTLESTRTLVEMIQIACGAKSGTIANSKLLDLRPRLPDSELPSQDGECRGPTKGTAATSDEIFQGVLGALWTSVVEPIFSSLNLEKTESPGRLWFCPTGPFAFLPIHAAGIYNTEDTQSVFDYVVPSYTPSLGSLLASHEPKLTDQFKMMVVIQPDIPDGDPLPFTKEELHSIEKHVPSDSLVKLGVAGNPATAEDVLSHLSTSQIVHFACHGEQDANNPLESCLILHGGTRLKINEFMKQLTPDASLAFLSACETATGAEQLPDEAIHLAASLLFAGFRGVVATMWSIADEDGPKIADSFYEHLFRDAFLSTSNQTCPNTIDAARALHYAVSKLRSDPRCSFRRWIPFIHMGL